MRKKVATKNKEDLFSMAKDYKKIDLSSYEGNLKIKDYFKKLSLDKSRLIFRRNCRILNCVCMNFKNKKKYRSERYSFPDFLNLNPTKTHLDDQDFLTTCEGNKDLRSDLDLSDLSQLAEYYRQIIARRIQLHEG